jgi:hypothetical protein
MCVGPNIWGLLCRDCQGFCEKYEPSEARSGDFSQNRAAAPTLTRPEKHSGTFAQGKGDFRFCEVPFYGMEIYSFDKVK